MAKNQTAPVAKAEPARDAVAARNASVGKCIIEAGKAAQSMLNKCKEGAKLAAAQLNPALPLGERVDAVMSLYADDFKTAGHNVKALFKDALLLLAADSCPVSVEVIGKDGKKVDAQTTAGEAVNLPKHAMREAAREVREVHGLGRKPGAGAKPKTAPAGEPAPDMQKTEAEQFADWLGELDEYLKDSVFFGKLQAHLIAAGYTINKAAPGRRVKGSASAKD